MTEKELSRYGLYSRKARAYCVRLPGGGTDMNSASLKSRLRNLAIIKEKKPYDYIHMHCMIERLLNRVSVQENTRSTDQ